MRAMCAHLSQALGKESQWQRTCAKMAELFERRNESLRDVEVHLTTFVEKHKRKRKHKKRTLWKVLKPYRLEFVGIIRNIALHCYSEHRQAQLAFEVSLEAKKQAILLSLEQERHAEQRRLERRLEQARHAEQRRLERRLEQARHAEQRRLERRLEQERHAEEIAAMVSSVARKRINHMLPINWILAGDEDLVKKLSIGQSDIDAVRHKFSWCTGFCEAFHAEEGCLQRMWDWFHKRDMLPAAVGSKKSPPVGPFQGTATTDTLSPMLCATLLQDAYESLGPILPHPHEAAATSSSVDIREKHDVQQVWITRSESGHTEEQCIALLLAVPTRGISRKPEVGALHNIARAHMPVKLPGVCWSVSELELTAEAVDVEYEHIVLTLPRVHFILHCADAQSFEMCGLELHGVHGAGKSSILRALAAALAVGSKTDTWLMAGFGSLRGVKSMNSSTHLDSFTSILASSTGRMVSSLHGHQPDIHDLRQLKDWLEMLDTRKFNFFDALEVTRQMLQPPAGLEDHMKPRVPALVVFDEVNEMLKTGDDAAFKTYAWGIANCKHHLRIQAASPDGVREDAESCRASVAFFELRPASALHMAAIISVAPHCILHGIKLDGTMDLAGVWAICRRFSSNMRQLALILAKAHVQCQQKSDTASSSINAGVFLEHMQEASHQVYPKYVSELSKRMQQPLTRAHALAPRHPYRPNLADQNGEPVRWGGQKHFSNASLLVRELASFRQSPMRYVGAIAADVQQDAVYQLLSRSEASSMPSVLSQAGPLSGHDFEEFVGQRLLLRAVARKVMLLRNLQDNINLFKQRPSDSSNTPFLASSRSAGQLVAATSLNGILWDASADAGGGTGQFARLHRNSQLLRVDADILRTIKLCRQVQGGGVCIINTAPNAPFCDFVVYRFDGQHHQLAFIEVTTSTLARHSSSKTLADSVKSPTAGAAPTAGQIAPHAAAGGGAASPPETAGKLIKARVRPRDTESSEAEVSKKARKRASLEASPHDTRGSTSKVPTPVLPASPVEVDMGPDYNKRMLTMLKECAPALRDTLSLLALPKYTVDDNSNLYQFANANASDESAVSVANAWLRVVGAPLRLKVSVKTKKKAGKKKTNAYHVTNVAVPGKEADVKNWSVSVVYISNMHLREQSAEGVSQLKTDMVHCLSEKHLDLVTRPNMSYS